MRETEKRIGGVKWECEEKEKGVEKERANSKAQNKRSKRKSK